VNIATHFIRARNNLSSSEEFSVTLFSGRGRKRARYREKRKGVAKTVVVVIIF